MGLSNSSNYRAIGQAILEIEALEIFLLLLFIDIHRNSPSSTVYSVTLLLFGVFEYFKYAIGDSNSVFKLCTAEFWNSLVEAQTVP